MDCAFLATFISQHSEQHSSNPGYPRKKTDFTMSFIRKLNFTTARYAVESKLAEVMAIIDDYEVSGVYVILLINGNGLVVVVFHVMFHLFSLTFALC